MSARTGSAATLLLLLLVACRGDELTRIPLAKAGDAGEAKWVVAGAKSAKVWARFHGGKWSGDNRHPDVSYEIELLDGAKSLTKVECSTSSCTGRVCGNGTGCECQTSCTLEAPADGTFTVRAHVKASSMRESEDLSIILRK